MNSKLLSIIGFGCGVLTLILAFIAGLEWDWGLIGLAAGAGLIATNLNVTMAAIKENKDK